MQTVKDNEVIIRLKRLLKKKGWSRYDLSKKTGISPNSLYSWINSGIVPSLANIERICNAANITIEQFFYDKGVDKLSDEESKLLNDWITLSDKEKQAIFLTIEAFKEARGT